MTLHARVELIRLEIGQLKSTAILTWKSVNSNISSMKNILNSLIKFTDSVQPQPLEAYLIFRL